MAQIKRTKIKKIRENIKYSVENPLRFMYRNGLGTAFDGGNHYGNDLSKVRDWVSDERAQVSNRWGHADKKSPFDPCPEGWRVPDVSFTHLYTGSKGNSPWYNGYNADAYGKQGVIQDQWHSIAQYYGGTVVGSAGWKFENPNYFHGQIPRDGIRGEVGEAKMSLTKSGLWTASMADMNTGFALALLIQNDKMQTGTGVYPQAGMGVRCAKDEKRLLGNTANTNKPSAPRPVLIQPKVSVAPTNEVQVSPNPFTDKFSITNSEGGTYEIFDMNGKLVQTGTPKAGNVSAPQLIKGLYIIKITLQDGSVVTKKLLKK